MAQAAAVIGPIASAAGSMLGGGSKGGKIKTDVKGTVGQANAILDKALDDALEYSEGYTNTAIDTIKDFYLQSRRDAREGYEMSKGLLAPYAKASYDALDMYLDTLGQVRPESSYMVGQALEGAARKRSLEGALTDMAYESSLDNPEYGGSGGGFGGMGYKSAAESERQLMEEYKGKIPPDQQIVLDHLKANEAAGIRGGPSQNQYPSSGAGYMNQYLANSYQSLADSNHGMIGNLSKDEQEIRRKAIKQAQPLLTQYNQLLGEQYNPELYGLALGWQQGNFSKPTEI